VQPRRLSARWVLPVEGPAISYGAVLIGASGRIEAVGPESTVPRPAEAAIEEFGEALLLPGLVNTHTHLELTDLDHGPPEPEFANWLLNVRRLKAARSPEQFLNAARRGLAQCHAAGVTTVADTGDSGAVVQALAEAGGSGIAYQEVFGPHPNQVSQSLAELQGRMEALGGFAGERVRLGVSPHAPYSVSGPLYAATATWAAAEGLPLATHVAESPAESELMEGGSGAFAEGWRVRGIPLPAPPGRTPVAWLDQHGVLGEHTLCIHVVNAGSEDLDRLARRGSAVAHCPLSNAAHGHGRAPLAGLLDRGLRVGLGTDSALSVGTLDLLAEARAARDLGGLDAGRALALCTIEAARALGLDDEIGSLTVGKWGDCVLIRPPSPTAASEPEKLTLTTGPADVLATLVGGRDVYRADRTL
jgi:cytosine/adenosine deaminase-related metal-dependent hydrolase